MIQVYLTWTKKKKQVKWQRKEAVHILELDDTLCLVCSRFSTDRWNDGGGMTREVFMDEVGYKLILN